MNDPLAPLKEQIRKIWDAVASKPDFRWGTVTQSSPLLVQLDGDDTAITPQSVAKTITVGRRVACIEQHRRVIILAVAEP